jgi:omega-amidase
VERIRMMGRSVAGNPPGPLTVGLVQLDIRDGDPEANLTRVTSLIRNAEPADLYIIPELFTTGYAYDAWPEAAARSATVVRRLQDLAEERSASIAAGAIALDSRRRMVNRLWLIGAGETPIGYDKRHLFTPLQEDVWLRAGDRRVQAQRKGWRLGLSLCFDLRFPEMYRDDALDGCHCFVVASEWPAERAGMLRVLARARAAENQTFLALCNRTGAAADGLRFNGGSALIAPDGEVLVDAGPDEGVVVRAMEPDGLAKARSWIDLLTLRRRDLRG